MVSTALLSLFSFAGSDSNFTLFAPILQQLLANTRLASEAGQFICTTFRPEMLLVAQKCYGVTYEQKSSKVLAVSRDEAMEFVQGEATK